MLFFEENLFSFTEKFQKHCLSRFQVTSNLLILWKTAHLSRNKSIAGRYVFIAFLFCSKDPIFERACGRRGKELTRLRVNGTRSQESLHQTPTPILYYLSRVRTAVGVIITGLLTVIRLQRCVLTCYRTLTWRQTTA
eukprot:scaffold421301_cov52-Attheya_sp.AAC.6